MIHLRFKPLFIEKLLLTQKYVTIFSQTVTLSLMHHLNLRNSNGGFQLKPNKTKLLLDWSYDSFCLTKLLTNIEWTQYQFLHSHAFLVESPPPSEVHFPTVFLKLLVKICAFILIYSGFHASISYFLRPIYCPFYTNDIPWFELRKMVTSNTVKSNQENRDIENPMLQGYAGKR